MSKSFRYFVLCLLFGHYFSTKNVKQHVNCVDMCLSSLQLHLFSLNRKAIQGEIKISTEDGETRTLRCAPDWGVSNWIDSGVLINDYDLSFTSGLIVVSIVSSPRKLPLTETIFGSQPVLRVIFVMLVKVNAQ